MEQNPLLPGKPTVVGIGASAGGLNALKAFFDCVPEDSDLAFVVVVHLSPDHKSHLADLLQPHIKFPVQQVTETIPINPNHVYIIPPNANLSAIDSHLRLSKLEVLRSQRSPIDHFFRTLADTHDGSSIGVILTGTGSDGTLGIKNIKAKGGLVIVQDPNQAEYDGMPQSAINSGLVDRVLPVEDIPAAILRYTQTEPRVSLLAAGQDEGERSEKLFLQKVFAHVRARTDRDFTRYKQTTVLRRIARRMQLNYLEDQQSYLEFLRENPDEARALADDFLITVTNFFRDPDVFQKLEKEIIPKLFDRKQPNEAIRVWSVGCATGEEAYSLAILLLEEAGRRTEVPQIQVFASDLHSHSLDKAREACYPSEIESDVSAARLERFFQKESAGGYRIQKSVRDLVVFAPHNLLSDPPFSRLDLISCRNLLIYLQRNVQRDVMELFHYALLPECYLLLGTAETIDAGDLFRTDDKKLCLYAKRNVKGPEPRLPVFPLSRLRMNGGGTAPKLEPVAFNTLHQRMLERYAPPSILVSPDNTVAQLSGRAGRYLIHPGGAVTANISRLVREELRLEIQAALQSSREKKQAVDTAPILVQFEEHSRSVVMHIRPALETEGDGFVLVFFEEPGESTDVHFPDRAKSPPVPEFQRVLDVEVKLADSQRRAQTVIEEFETGQEEMKASNEELQSTNEELRSTMEELETSKEELQSINEELQTVNQENRHKVEELAQLTSDLQNLLVVTDIATLFLDRSLRILRFTPKLGELFNIRLTDRGRPISDLTHRLGYSELVSDSWSVLNRLIPIEREVQDERGSSYLTRVLPYRSAEDRIEGIVITFIDITKRKAAEESLRASGEKYRSLFNSMNEAFVIKEAVVNQAGEISDFLYVDCNPAFMKQTGLEDPRGRTITQVTPEIEPIWLDKYRQVVETGEPVQFEAYRASLNRWLFMSVSRLGGADSRRIAVTFSDTTQRKNAEIAQAQSELRLRTVLEGIPQLVWRARTNGSWTWASPQWLSFTGQSEEESHGLGWLEAVHPEDREHAWKTWGNKDQTSRLDLEYRLRRHSDGAYLWHHSRSLPVRNSAGDISEWLGTSTDIEGLKRAEATLRQTEEQFRLFVENVREYALVQTDLNGMVTTWNPGAERLFGYHSAEVLGMHFAQLVGSDADQKRLLHEFSEVADGHKMEDAQWLTRKEGTRFWARWVSEPVYDDHGQLRGVAKLMRDETERKQIETTVRTSLAEKEELLKEVHHRVKNNLQVITSLLNLQSGQVQDTQFLALFEETRNRVQSIASIHELLYKSDSFSAIELATYARQLLPNLLRFYGVEDRVQGKVVGSGATLELERAVPFGLLLNELVSNSLKHGFPGGARGEVRVEISKQESHITVLVVDTGIGMAHGFDDDYSNTLGLKLVRLLTRQLGGTIELKPGPGTTFELRVSSPASGESE